MAQHPHLTKFADVLVGARLAVESLDYLEQLDASMMPGSTPLGFDPTVVEAAHSRWAVGTAVTAIDLCAAVIGRLHAGYPKPSGAELDVGGALRLCSPLSTACPDAWAWLQHVNADIDYQTLLRARHGFVHRAVVHRGKVVVIVPSDGPGNRQIQATACRPDFCVPGSTPDWRSTASLIATARDVAGNHVTAFRDLVASQLV